MNSKFRIPLFNTPAGRLVLFALVIGLMLLPELVLASQASTGQKLPYEQGLENFTNSLKGPVAFGISLVGIVGAGAMLIFGGDMSGFLRSMIFLILVIAIIVNATGLIGIIDSNAALVADAASTAIPALLHGQRLLI